MFLYYALQPSTYCAIWVRRSNFRHQASPRVSPRESTQRRKVELWARNIREFCLNADFNVTFRNLLHAVKLRHGTDGFTSPPREGVLRNFFALKIRQLRPGVNPRTWVPKASTLPLDHRSRSLAGLFYFVQTEHPFCQYRCNLLHKCYREETHKHDQRQGFRNICKSIPHSKVSD